MKLWQIKCRTKRGQTETHELYARNARALCTVLSTEIGSQIESFVALVIPETREQTTPTLELLREQAGLTLAQTAALIGTNPQKVRAIERGECPAYEYESRLADALGVTEQAIRDAVDAHCAVIHPPDAEASWYRRARGLSVHQLAATGRMRMHDVHEIETLQETRESQVTRYALACKAEPRHVFRLIRSLAKK